MAYYTPLSDCFHFRTTCNNLLVISRFKQFDVILKKFSHDVQRTVYVCIKWTGKIS